LPQFLISEDDLKNIYDAIQGAGDTTRALMVLSEPVDEEIDRSEVYVDIYILTLNFAQLDYLVVAIAEQSSDSAAIVSVTRNVKRGIVSRTDEDDVEYDGEDDDGEDDDGEDDDGEDDDEWSPGDFGHPLNADGSKRELTLIEGYCVACKDSRIFSGVVKISESGRKMAQGACPVCNTRMAKSMD
jgi:hypothetical protein